MGGYECTEDCHAPYASKSLGDRESNTSQSRPQKVLAHKVAANASGPLSAEILWRAVMTTDLSQCDKEVARLEKLAELPHDERTPRIGERGRSL